jgi:hypothetical protein
MSEAAYDLSRKVLRLCRSCAERKARFRFRGVVKADRDHSLCFECFRAERDRRRAQTLAEAPAPRQLSLHFAPTTLTQRATEHRRRMLAHMEAAGEQRSARS